MEQHLPKGWTVEKIQRVLEYYDNQTEDEAVEEDESAFGSSGHVTVAIPNELLPQVSALLQEFEEKRMRKVKTKKKKL